jgi:hypothetical protein
MDSPTRPVNSRRRDLEARTSNVVTKGRGRRTKRGRGKEVTINKGVRD